MDFNVRNPPIPPIRVLELIQAAGIKGLKSVFELLKVRYFPHSLCKEDNTMRVYLVQHGQAHPKDADPSRSLTERGRHETERVANLAAQLNLGLHQIRHSGKTRAAQTAAILGQALSPAGGVVAVPGLAPKDDVRPVAEALADEARDIMLVGHLPFMARLAGLLLAGDPKRAVVRFRNAGIICLAREDGRWQVAWSLTPEMAGAY